VAVEVVQEIRLPVVVQEVIGVRFLERPPVVAVLLKVRLA
jgi:hypothetical protein